MRGCLIGQVDGGIKVGFGSELVESDAVQAAEVQGAGGPCRFSGGGCLIRLAPDGYRLVEIRRRP